MVIAWVIAGEPEASDARTAASAAFASLDFVSSALVTSTARPTAPNKGIAAIATMIA
jgi:hypothetical protein